MDLALNKSSKNDLSSNKPGNSFFKDWILSQERIELANHLKNLPGKFLLQLADAVYFENLNPGPGFHNFTLKSKILTPDLDKASVYGKYEKLPIASDTIDLVVLPHVLQTDNFQSTLAEAWRVLAAYGYIFILAFNPWSLGGLTKFRNTQPNTIKKAPSLASVRQWFTELNAEIITLKTFCYRLPNKKFTNKNPNWLDFIGQMICPLAGNIYILVARKRVIPLKPIKANWQLTEKVLTNKNLAEPTAGNVRRGSTGATGRE